MAAAQRLVVVRTQPQLVQDPAGLLLGQRIDPPALYPGQRLQRAERQADVERQGHPAGEQAVAPEQGHEPGRAGRDERVPAGRLDAQRAEVVLAAAQHVGEDRVVGVDAGAGAAPVTDLAGGGAGLDALLASDVQARSAGHGRLGEQLHGPARPGRDDGAPQQRA